jgi:purine-binding chemotaxis protein CheW
MPEPREAPSVAPEPAPGEGWLFCVRAGAGRYGFDAGLVSEVVRLGPLTRLPGAPAALPGVFTHRGEVLAVLDLCQVLGLPAAPLGVGSRVAVLRIGAWRLALLADAVLGLAQVPAAEREPAPAQGGPAGRWLRAVGRAGAEPVAILDLAALVQDARQRSFAP